MENQKVMQLVEEVVKDEIRKGDLIKTKDVLSMLPEVIDTVHIDRKRMRFSIEQCLTTKNPINALLKLFGVQLIKKEKTINNLLNSSTDQSDVSVQIDDSYAKRWLTLSTKEFRTVVEKIALKLYTLERRANETYDNEKKRGDDLFTKYENLSKEYIDLKYNSDANEKMIAERIQYILSITGKEMTPSNEQLVELLKDLNIEVYWDSNDAPLTDVAMFTEYTIDDEIFASTKPCLIRNGSVYVKGMRFIRK